MTQSAAPSDLPAPGVPFPDFSLPDAQGKLHRLSDYAGRYLVLYVYPKDDTPGCTKEACDFRDHFQEGTELRAHGAAILGVSRDDAGSHASFGEKYSLNFPLLSDPEAAFIKTVGGWGARTSFGKTGEGVKRVTFLIAPDGTLARAWANVKVEEHAQDVLRELERHKLEGDRVAHA